MIELKEVCCRQREGLSTHPALRPFWQAKSAMVLLSRSRDACWPATWPQRVTID